MVVRYQPKGWIVESTLFHGENLVRCDIVGGGKRTPLISAYLLPSILEKLTDLEEALTRFWDQDTIVLGDINSDICQAQNPHSQQVMDLMMEFGMVDLLHHLQQRW